MKLTTTQINKIEKLLGAKCDYSKGANIGLSNETHQYEIYNGEFHAFKYGESKIIRHYTPINIDMLIEINNIIKGAQND